MGPKATNFIAQMLARGLRNIIGEYLPLVCGVAASLYRRSLLVWPSNFSAPATLEWDTISLLCQHPIMQHPRQSGALQAPTGA